MKHSKFSISDMVANSSNGMASAGKAVGAYLCLFGTSTFAYACGYVSAIEGRSDILIQSLAIITLGVGLIVGKIIKPTKETNTDTE